MLKRICSSTLKSIAKPVRFSFSTKDIKPNGIESEGNSIYSQEYDAHKYKVHTNNIKYATSYSLTEVEPFPRDKIMKIGHIMLDKLKTLPADSLYRNYTEEKFKYIMKLASETEDIRGLETKFGYDSIEMFIQNLHDEIALFDRLKDSKVWEAREIEDEELLHFSKTPKGSLKHTRHDRPAREEKKFL